MVIRIARLSEIGQRELDDEYTMINAGPFVTVALTRHGSDRARTAADKAGLHEVTQSG